MNNISPIDGRYKYKSKILSLFFSEFSLMKWRITFELKYLDYLKEIIPEMKNYNNITSNNFDSKEYDKIKSIEMETRHDIKAVEYYIRNLFKESNNDKYIPFIHIGLTSHDINSITKSYLMKQFIITVLIPQLNNVIDTINNISSNWNITILGRTHGQFATPTNLRKEMKVYTSRLKYQIDILKSIKHRCKLGGATGGFNAMKLIYPNIDWNNKLDEFCNRLSLVRHRYTTQIDHYDNYSEIFDTCKRINVILIDLCQDIWLYISYNYFNLKTNDKEIGSSTMPHKINPISFENCEGNLKLGNTLFNFLSDKLPISRLQRDLTDSTVSRNIGVPFGHMVIGIESLLSGLIKLEPNRETINNDLNNNYQILGEAIQTVLRKNGYKNAYEIIKDLTRNNRTLNKDQYINMVNQLDIPDKDRTLLLDLSPSTYIGL
jgi:adenylosuccinate lyase